MVEQATLVSDLQSIVGVEHAREPQAASPDATVDGMTPRAAVSPGSYEEVAAVMRYANDNGLAVIPLCSGGMFGGNIPRGYDIALSVSRLNEIIEYEPADLTITCQAGATLGDLHVTLSKAGQMTPFGSNASESCVGGLLARSRSHNLRYGSPRDYTIGMRVITADGRITRAGGKVVKNVAGYDLCKLYIGSLGTLGVIVEATLKVVPQPQVERRVELVFTSGRGACDFAAELQRRGLSLWQVNLCRSMSFAGPGSAPLSLRIDLAGTAAAVERSQQEVVTLALEAGAEQGRNDTPKATATHPEDGSQGISLACDVSVLPSDVPALIEALDSTAPGAWISASPLRGAVEFVWPGAGTDEMIVREVRTATSRFGGTLVVTACSTELKRRIDVFGDPPPSFELMRRIKQQFDPKGILSPGRFVGRL